MSRGPTLVELEMLDESQRFLRKKESLGRVCHRHRDVRPVLSHEGQSLLVSVFFVMNSTENQRKEGAIIHQNSTITLWHISDLENQRYKLRCYHRMASRQTQHTKLFQAVMQESVIKWQVRQAQKQVRQLSEKRPEIALWPLFSEIRRFSVFLRVSYLIWIRCNASIPSGVHIKLICIICGI